MDKFELENGNEHARVRNWKLLLSCFVAIIIFLIVCFAISQFVGVDRNQAYPVYINEILASNSSYPNEDGRCCDYIELYNSADYPIDLSGFLLGDVSGSNRYAFPYGTVIGAGEYLVVYCDSTVTEPGYAPFGISRAGGELFYLIGSNGAVLDSVTTIASDMDQPMVRSGDGTLTLTNVVTPGGDNHITLSGIQDIYNSNVSELRITEISAVETGYIREHGVFADWVEIYNSGAQTADIGGFSLSDNIGNTKYRFPEGTSIAAGEYLVVYCSTLVTDSTVAPFGLSKYGAETVVLKDANGLVVEIVETVSMDLGSQILCDDGSWSNTDTPSPGYPNTADGYAAFIHEIGASSGVIRISEVMSDSIALLPDCDGDFSDWIELYNAGNQPVNLDGWYLSDDPQSPQKWSFPSLTIPAGERAIIYCSGKDGVFDGEIHTSFSLSASGESLVLSSYLGQRIHSVIFGKAEPNRAFVFNGELTETMKPTPGFSNDDQGYYQFCDSNKPAGPLAIWEVMVSNDTYLPQNLGKCYDWVEIRNISNQTVKLSDYSITDDPAIPELYVLPNKNLAPGDSVVIILSGDTSLATKRYEHAPFSLNADFDQLLIYANDRNLIDYVCLEEIPLNMSYGRSDAFGGFSYMEPTPQNPNKAGYRLISAMPNSNYLPGVYSSDNGLEVTLEADGVIYYSLDGSEPTRGSTRYTGPIQIDETSVLRAIAVEENQLASKIYTATFVIGVDHDLPIVSLVTDPDGLWSKNGVYTDGDLSVKEIGLSGNIAYSGEDGRFSMDCELGMHGETSLLVFDKKSFKVRFKDVYDGLLQYDVFEDNEVTVFSSLIIRAAHESTYSTHLHDAFIASFASENCKSVISQKYKYIAMYLNGEYWGLYAIREHHSEEHYASYMQVPAETVTMVRYTTDLKNDLKKLYTFSKTKRLASEKDYNWAKEIIDIESFVDWMILEAYMSNIDINNNMRYYFDTVNQRWYCGLADLDLGIVGSSGAFGQLLDSWHHGEIPGALMANEEFVEYSALRLAELLSGAMSDENMLKRLESMADEIRSEVTRDAARWNYPVSGWERFYKDMVKFVDGRAIEMINSFCVEANFTKSEKADYFGSLLP